MKDKDKTFEQLLGDLKIAYVQLGRVEQLREQFDSTFGKEEKDE